MSYLDTHGLTTLWNKIKTYVSNYHDTTKQNTLVSGTNIKTVNSNSLLGSGNVSVGTYSKPSTGIPKTDLDGTVQASLNRADSMPTALAEKEDISNKVSSWSSTTNNTHYPGEKLVKDSLDGKVDKVSGKGLSTNDFTTTLKNKLDGIDLSEYVPKQSESSVNISNRHYTRFSVGNETVVDFGKDGTSAARFYVTPSVVINGVDYNLLHGQPITNAEIDTICS